MEALSRRRYLPLTLYTVYSKRDWSFGSWLVVWFAPLIFWGLFSLFFPALWRSRPFGPLFGFIIFDTWQITGLLRRPHPFDNSYLDILNPFLFISPSLDRTELRVSRGPEKPASRCPMHPEYFAHDNGGAQGALGARVSGRALPCSRPRTMSAAASSGREATN